MRAHVSDINDKVTVATEPVEVALVWELEVQVALLQLGPRMLVSSPRVLGSQVVNRVVVYGLLAGWGQHLPRLLLRIVLAQQLPHALCYKHPRSWLHHWEPRGNGLRA